MAPPFLEILQFVCPYVQQNEHVAFMPLTGARAISRYNLY